MTVHSALFGKPVPKELQLPTLLKSVICDHNTQQP